MNSLPVSVCRRIAILLAFGLALICNSSKAAMVTVDVGDNFFRPAVTNIKVGDSVRWAWIGLNQHSSTHNANPRLWDSGLRNPGQTFTNTFNSVGSYPYFCTVPTHVGQNGTINVASDNTPPTVAMQFPTNNTIYALPAIIRLTANASDPNGTVTNVQFLRNATLLTNDTSIPYEAVDNNPPQGTLSYAAIATDNLGDKSTNRVTVTIVTPIDIRLTNQTRLSETQFRFTYTGNPGLRYVVEKSSDFTTWQSLGTNRASGATTTFTDDAATAAQNLYRVGRAPNP